MKRDLSMREYDAAIRLQDAANNGERFQKRSVITDPNFPLYVAASASGIIAASGTPSNSLMRQHVATLALEMAETLSREVENLRDIYQNMALENGKRSRTKSRSPVPSPSLVPSRNGD
jgi:hypothetical protein